MSDLTKRYLDEKKRLEESKNARCQRCLESGHWTYQCTNPRKYISQPSRTQLFKRKAKMIELMKKAKELAEKEAEEKAKVAKKRYKNLTGTSDDTSSTSSESTSDNDSMSDSSSDRSDKHQKKIKKVGKRK